MFSFDGTGFRVPKAFGSGDFEQRMWRITAACECSRESKSWPENTVEGAETRFGGEGDDEQAIGAKAGEETVGEGVLVDWGELGGV